MGSATHDMSLAVFVVVVLGGEGDCVGGWGAKLRSSYVVFSWLVGGVCLLRVSCVFRCSSGCLVLMSDGGWAGSGVGGTVVGYCCG